MESKFTGTKGGLSWTAFVEVFLTIITLGIAKPWAVCRTQRWMAKHTIIDGKQMKFDGTGGALFGQYLKWFFLTIITFGIYGSVVKLRMHQWVIAHTHLVETAAEETK
jgi:uncharacterized membrane protein YjgN (DUF898 family)